MKKYGKTDANQGEVISALRAIGCTVQDLSPMGGGCPDLLVGIFGRNLLIEVKDGSKPPSARDLTPQQSIWHNEWKGQKAIARNALEAVAIVNERLAK